LAKEHSPDPTRLRNHRPDRYVLDDGGAHHVEKFFQPIPLHFPEARLLANLGERRNLPESAFERVGRLVQDFRDGRVEPEEIDPRNALPRLQGRRRKIGDRARRVGFQQAGELGEFPGVLRKFPPLVRRGRGAGEADADAPMIAGRHHHERVNPAGFRLRGCAELRVDPAAVVVAEEDARPLRRVGEGVFAAGLHDRVHFLEAGYGAPRLLGDRLALRRGHGHAVRTAAIGATPAVPVLHRRQRTHRHRHFGIFRNKGLARSAHRL